MINRLREMAGRIRSFFRKREMDQDLESELAAAFTKTAEDLESDQLQGALTAAGSAFSDWRLAHGNRRRMSSCAPAPASSA